MARRSTRDLWKDRLTGRLRAPEWDISPQEVAGRRFHGVVLGIDPSLRGTGLAVLQFQPDQPIKLLCSETVKLRRSLPMPDCLGQIWRAVHSLLNAHPVDHVALEGSIYVQNTQTALLLGAARGAAIAAAAGQSLPVFEYAPLRIKQAVVGFGRASKPQVAKTVRSLLGLEYTLKPDEADAAGVAICHAFNHRGN